MHNNVMMPRLVLTTLSTLFFTFAVVLISFQPSQAQDNQSLVLQPFGDALSWSPNGIFIPTDIYASRAPQIWSDGIGQLYIIWAEADNNVYFRYRNADGIWSAIEQVDDDSDMAIHFPDITADGYGNAYAIWLESSPNSLYRVMYNQRTSDGLWSTPQPIQAVMGDVVQSTVAPVITANRSGDLLAAWISSSYSPFPEGNNTLFTRFKPQGEPWGPHEIANSAQVNQFNDLLSIGLDDTSVSYLMWRFRPIGGDGLVYFSKSTPGGDWDTPVQVDSGDSTVANYGRIAVDPAGNAYAILATIFNPQIFRTYRPAGGSWQDKIEIDTSYSGYGCGSGDTAVNANGDVIMVWFCGSTSATTGTLYYSYKSNGGSWSIPDTITHFPERLEYAPSVALNDAGNAYAVWYIVNEEFDEFIGFATTQQVFFPATKEAFSLEAIPGSTSTYEIVLNNTLPFSTSFSVIDALPADTAYLEGSFTASGGTVVTNTSAITWTGSINSNETLSATFSIQISDDITSTIPPGGSLVIVNTAHAAAAPQNSTLLQAITIVNPKQVYLPIVLGVAETVNSH